MFEMSVMNLQTSSTERSITTPFPSTLVMSATLQLQGRTGNVSTRPWERRHGRGDSAPESHQHDPLMGERSRFGLALLCTIRLHQRPWERVHPAWGGPPPPSHRTSP